MIRLIIFDLDDTLYHEKQYVLSGFRAVANFLGQKKVGISSDKIYKALAKSFSLEGRGKNFNQIIRQFNIDSKYLKSMIREYREHLPNIFLDSATKKVLEDLHKKNTLVLLTNGWAEVQKNKVTALGLNRYFDSFFYAQEDGLKFCKPHSKFFLKILKHYNVKPEESLMVGDDLVCDIQGAANLDFQTFYIKKLADLKQLKDFLKQKNIFISLFKPDNFSDPTINYHQLAITKALEFGFLNIFFPQYKVIFFGQLEGTEINSNNFKIKLKKEEKVRTILLRKFKTLKNKEQIIFYLELLHDLKKRGVKVSKLIKGSTGENIFENNGNYYALFDFIEASHFMPQESGFLSLAKEIAKMHQSFDDFGNNCAAKVGELSARNQGIYFNKIKSYSTSDFDKIEEIIRQKEKKEEVDDFIFKNFFLIKKCVRKIEEARERVGSLPKKIIHSDLHPHNILMRNNKVVAILDFDGMRLSERARDVGCAIYRFGRQFFVNKEINKDKIKKQAVSLRKKFLKAYVDIIPLTKSEENLMPFLVLDEFLTKLLFVLRGVYEEGNKTWAKDLPKFLAALEEINYFWPII
ncbi:MAG: HAD-IA family hydrolase [Candidatus Staskawiczbacteria bacterium]|nr:HAD-IA family hydrolase [Candidatus Staskawiczbacteria bacterium]